VWVRYFSCGILVSFRFDELTMMVSVGMEVAGPVEKGMALRPRRSCSSATPVPGGVDSAP
jgi:hypothetical protein